MPARPPAPALPRRRLLAAAATLAAPRPATATPNGHPQRLRIGVVAGGTLSWLLTAMPPEATERLTIRLVDSPPPAAAALQGDFADIIVADWIWALRQSDEWGPLRFAPHGFAMGGLLVPALSNLGDLAHLRGVRLGVMGGPFDKTWLLLRANCVAMLGAPAEELLQARFGRDSALLEDLGQGRLDALLAYWTTAARLRAQGYRLTITAAGLMQGLGVRPVPPLLGFVWPRDRLAGRGAEVSAFLQAAAAADARLAQDDGWWAANPPVLNAAGAAEVVALRDGYRSGIAHGWGEAETRAAQRMFALLRNVGGAQITGPSTRFDGSMFVTAADLPLPG